MQSLWMVFASFLFACMGVCVKWASATFSPSEIVFYRTFLAHLMMLVLVRLRGVSIATPHWRWQISRAVAGFLALVCYFTAISLLPLATAVTLNYTSAIFLAIILAWKGWRLDWGTLASLAVGLLGIAWLLRPGIQADQWLGEAAGLGSGMFAGMAYYNVRELGVLREPETRTVFYFSLVSTMGAGIWLIFSSVHMPDLVGALQLVGVAGFATGGQLALTRAYARGRTLAAAACAYTGVVFASLLGAAFFGDVLDAESCLAMGVIILSGIAATHFTRTAPAESD